MRAFFVAVAGLCAACSPASNSGLNSGNAAANGYRLEIRADDAQQFYLITAPDGRMTGARHAREGDVSTLLDALAIHALAPAPAADLTTDLNNPNSVSIHAPGFSLQASGNDNDKGAGKENGDAHISMNFGGHGMQIDAHGNNGDAGDAHVVITGADEKTARNFISDAHEISPEVQQQMLTALGLH